MKNNSSYTHKTGSWFLLGILFKISDKHPHPFYMRVPPPPPPPPLWVPNKYQDLELSLSKLNQRIIIAPYIWNNFKWKISTTFTVTHDLKLQINLYFHIIIYLLTKPAFCWTLRVSTLINVYFLLKKTIYFQADKGQEYTCRKSSARKSCVDVLANSHH